MSFDSFAEFLAMGGHGLYVWTAYAITLVVFLGNLVQPFMGRRSFFRTQKQVLRREEARESES